MSTPAKVLLVDDDANTLKSIGTLIQKRGHALLTASNADEARTTLSHQNDIAVLICDINLPGENGVAVLEYAKEQCPGTVRIAFTGNDEREAMLTCINRGDVNNFIRKPWNATSLHLLEEAIEQFNLKHQTRILQEKAERQAADIQRINHRLTELVRERTQELTTARHSIQQTLNGTVQMLSNLVEMHAPGLRGHARRVAKLSRLLAETLDCSPAVVARIEQAAILHDVGKISASSEILGLPPEQLTSQQREVIRRHSQVGHQILVEIPGFEDIALAVRHHHEAVNGQGYPDKLTRADIPESSRIIAVADYYDRCLYPHGRSHMRNADDALRRLAGSAGTLLDPVMVEAFIRADLPVRATASSHEVEIAMEALEPGMVLSRDVRNVSGRTLLRLGTRLDHEKVIMLQKSEETDPLLSRVYVSRSSLPLEPSEEGRAIAVERLAQRPLLDDERPLIVVVDDQRAIINALRRELRRAGYDVEGFTEPSGALTFLRAHSEVLAVITDYRMSGGGGDCFLQEAQRFRPDLPCLVVTAVMTKDTVLQFKQTARVIRMFSKPWDKEALLETLQQIRGGTAPEPVGPVHPSPESGNPNH